MFLKSRKLNLKLVGIDELNRVFVGPATLRTRLLPYTDPPLLLKSHDFDVQVIGNVLACTAEQQCYRNTRRDVDKIMSLSHCHHVPIIKELIHAQVETKLAVYSPIMEQIYGRHAQVAAEVKIICVVVGHS